MPCKVQAVSEPMCHILFVIVQYILKQCKGTVIFLVSKEHRSNRSSTNRQVSKEHLASCSLLFTARHMILLCLTTIDHADFLPKQKNCLLKYKKAKILIFSNTYKLYQVQRGWYTWWQNLALRFLCSNIYSCHVGSVVYEVAFYTVTYQYSDFTFSR